MDKMHSNELTKGIELLRAWFAGHAYDSHRHDTYAIGLTDSGVQSFDYRGVTENSEPGRVMVLHPDELHNGRAGSDEGFGYKMLYVNPAHISDAVRIIVGRPCPLPFVKDAVSDNRVLANAVRFASDCALSTTEPLASDEIIERLAQGLIVGDPDCIRLSRKYTIDYNAVDIAREFLEQENARVVHSSELEAITGLTRYDLSRQFRKVLGTSPYKYSVNRRLDIARNLLREGRSLANVAIDTGFSDQAHFSRLFKASYGMPPGRYSKLGNGS